MRQCGLACAKCEFAVAMAPHVLMGHVTSSTSDCWQVEKSIFNHSPFTPAQLGQPVTAGTAAPRKLTPAGNSTITLNPISLRSAPARPADSCDLALAAKRPFSLFRHLVLWCAASLHSPPATRHQTNANATSRGLWYTVSPRVHV